MMKRLRPRCLALTTAACGFAILSSSTVAQFQHPSRVDLAFNRWYDYAETTQALHDLVEAYPELLTIQSLGQSTGGRELWLVTLNNEETGPHTSKAAMWIDGNIHGNEIQATETVLYSIWYLTKSYGKIDALTELMDERAFYFMPMMNPDGRDIWFHEPATPHFIRSGIEPTDSDHDGHYDEDGYDDLDGDGHITQMYRRDPLGRWKWDPKDPRYMTRVGEDEEPGGWTFVGWEGIDRDEDGRFNEDNIGGYDMNRNWPSDWQPGYIQFGSGDYPLQYPEVRAAAEFLLDHPNIAAFQSYHNTGGMILRGPGARYVTYPQQDVRVYERLQDVGTDMLPFYRKMVIWSDLYTVHGGMVNWAYEGLGIMAFTNELWTDRKMFQDGRNPTQEQQRQFRELLQFDEVLVPFKPFDHPQLGEVLIGGMKKWSSRVAPPWLQEEDAHRNFAFTLFHAREMPKVEWGLLQVRPLGPDLWEVTIEVRNPRLIPTITAMSRQNRIGARDRIDCIPGPAANVVASGTVASFHPDANLEAQERRPQRIWNDSGIGGRGNQLFRFLVSGRGSVEIEYWSEKGGLIRRTIELVETVPPHPGD